MVELQVANRRKEERIAASGSILLILDEPLPHETQGLLLDRSSSGFRAAHCCPEIRPGLVVGFRTGRRSGRAQVMWNRIADGGLESGFRILSGNL
jgi:hypothetical protein